VLSRAVERAACRVSVRRHHVHETANLLHLEAAWGVISTRGQAPQCNRSPGNCTQARARHWAYAQLLRFMAHAHSAFRRPRAPTRQAAAEERRSLVSADFPPTRWRCAQMHQQDATRSDANASTRNSSSAHARTSDRIGQLSCALTKQHPRFWCHW
jgi:hypothetical protein